MLRFRCRGGYLFRGQIYSYLFHRKKNKFMNRLRTFLTNREYVARMFYRRGLNPDGTPDWGVRVWKHGIKDRYLPTVLASIRKYYPDTEYVDFYCKQSRAYQFREKM